MAIRDIIRMGHPTLRQVAELYPVDKIGSKEFHALIQDMQETLAKSGGIGLAAPQINVSTQIVIVDVPDTGSRYGDIPELPFSIYINPTITVLPSEKAGFWEGCLSIPGMMGYVERAQHIKIDYTNENGAHQTVELKDFLATVFQHEFDHLTGTLYIDRIEDLSLFCYEQEYTDFYREDEDD